MLTLYAGLNLVGWVLTWRYTTDGDVRIVAGWLIALGVAAFLWDWLA